MKVSLLKQKNKQCTIARTGLQDVVKSIRDCVYSSAVYQLREVYMFSRRMDDGSIETDFKLDEKVPRACFAADMKNTNGERKLLEYNGLVTLEAGNLADYDTAIALRNEAARLPYTTMAYVGVSGRSVVIVVRGELYPDGSGNTLPTEDAEIKQFHRKLYQKARRVYCDQIGITFDMVVPEVDRAVYLSADPDIKYNADATPLYPDAQRDADTNKRAAATSENEQLQSRLMPGRTLSRTYHLNFQFILDSVLGKYFELPDEDRVAQMLMQIAGKCLEEGIPQAQALSLIMSHPLLNGDRLLVEKTIDNVYTVENMAKYYERRGIKPLKSVPEDTLLMMKTDMFLEANYEMRLNVMTGVAQYRDKTSEDMEFHDLDEVVRNEMTMRAKELGLKSWDKDIARFINSPRIKSFDPVNFWLDHLPRWDGRDRIEALAARVPCDNPHWNKYFRTWLLAMTAHWMGRAGLTGNALTPLLIGRQGCGKSSFCRILLPPELRDYYNDRINFKNENDLNLGLTSFALINIDEFDKTTARQQIVLKYLLSTADLKFRPPYGKAYKQYRRYASFIATTNALQPLTDPSGARRFICTEVTGTIDFTDNIEHRQLFAQLKHLVMEKKERYWLTDEETLQLIEDNKRFSTTASLDAIIDRIFTKPLSEQDGSWWSVAEITECIEKHFGKKALRNVSSEKLGHILSSHKFDFEKKRTKTGQKYLLAEIGGGE